MHLLLVLALAGGASVHAAERELLARLYDVPPSPCLAVPHDAPTALVAIAPEGIAREETVAHLAAMGGLFLARGAERMTPRHIETVFTAVFYQEMPANEVGAYGYLFREPVDVAMFAGHEELNGRVFVVGGRLLVLLWHEGLDRAGACYAALAERIGAEAD